ncbi:NADPH-dependent FMN reductase [Chitinophaga lutea]
MKTIGIIPGSLRAASFSKKVGNALLGMAPEGVTFKIISIEGLPVYNQDFDDHGPLPESYAAFRSEIKALDGVIFVTPEHNRSVPAALKNAIDVASRPYGKNTWSGKPAAVFSNSPGALSGFGANHHLRQSLVFLNMPAMAQPEVYLQHINKDFDESGKLINDDTRKFLQKAVDAYIAFFNKNTP